MLDVARERAREFWNAPCCTFVAKALAYLYGAESRYNESKRDWWARANIWDENEPFSNLEAYAEVLASIGGNAQYNVMNNITWRRVEGLLRKGQWYIMQGWRENGTGHTFFIRISKGRKDEGFILESSVGRGLRGNRKPLLAEHEYPDIEIRDYITQFRDLGVCPFP